MNVYEFCYESVNGIKIKITEKQKVCVCVCMYVDESVLNNYLN